MFTKWVAVARKSIKLNAFSAIFEMELMVASALVNTMIFDKNCGHQTHHELQHEKIMHFDPGDVDFRATATHFVNILMFLLFFEQNIVSKIPRETTGGNLLS